MAKAKMPKMPDKEAPEQQAAVIPTRPVAGATVATAWGQDVHDRIYTPKGIIAWGPIVNAPADFATLAVDSVIAGSAALLVANQIVIPTALGGLYHASLLFEARFGTAPGADWWADLSDIANNPYIRIGNLKPAANIAWVAGSAVIPAPNGITLRVQWRGLVPTSVQVMRLSVIRIGEVLA